MNIYKFKDLRHKSVHHHLFQIIDENKVWCAAPDTLNDEDEFNFKMDCTPSTQTRALIMKVLEKLGKSHFPPYMTASYAILNNKLEEFTKPLVSDIVTQFRKNIGVTSFSTIGSGEWLWEEYGGSGNGVIVEFEMKEESLGSTFHRVTYVPEKVFHVDVFLDSQVSDPRKLFKNILCTKTRHWIDEEEIRFLGKTPNINITFEAPVKAITIGNKVEEQLARQLEKKCQNRNIKVNYQK